MKNNNFALSVKAILGFVLCFAIAVIFWYFVSYGDLDIFNLFNYKNG